jgi:large subunit ribosomal protein L29
MEAEKIRNLSDGELKQQEREQMDQLFRLKFQLKMGQSESLKKIQELRRGVARLKTIARERTLGIVVPHAAPVNATATAKSASASKSGAHLKASAAGKKKHAAPAVKVKSKVKAKTVGKKKQGKR